MSDISDGNWLALLNDPQFLAAAQSGALGPRGAENPLNYGPGPLSLPSGTLIDVSRTPQGAPLAAANQNMAGLQEQISGLANQMAAPVPTTPMPEQAPLPPPGPRRRLWDPNQFAEDPFGNPIPGGSV